MADYIQEHLHCYSPIAQNMMQTIQNLDLDNGAAVYMIYHDDQVYIGATTNVKHRLRSHLADLDINKHPCTHLQNLANTIGITKLKYEVLEYVSDINILPLIEIKHMSHSLESGKTLLNLNRNISSTPSWQIPKTILPHLQTIANILYPNLYSPPT